MVVLLQSVFERSMPSDLIRGGSRRNLKPFAGVGVTHRQHEEAEAEGQHEDIQHQVLLVALVSLRHACVLQGRRIALDLYGIAAAIRALPVAVAVKCHSPHMFSRRARNQSYRNLIKTRLYACACCPTRGSS